MASSEISLRRDEARRIAVRAAMLAGARPRSVLAVATHLGGLQMDPTSVVARSERLVLFSRLGPYDVRALERDLWQRRRLFEYAAYIVPMADYPIHRETSLVPCLRRGVRPCARSRERKSYPPARTAASRSAIQ